MSEPHYEEPRVPPQNLEAEEAVLGAMLLSASACDVVSEILESGDFYKQSHGVIYRAALALHARDEPVDAIAVRDELEKRGEIEAAGGRVRLSELAAMVFATANAGHYARIVRDCATRRDLIKLGQETIREGYEAGDVDKVEQAVYALSNRDNRDIDLDPGARDYIATLERLRDNPGELIGVPSGFHAVDEITQGFEPGNLVIVGARPSMGKSAFLFCVIRNVLARDLPVGLITLEMSKGEVMQRLVSIAASLPGEKLRNPRKLTDEEWRTARDAAAKIDGKPLYVRQAGSLTPTELRAQIRRLKARVPNLALVGVDYLQLMTTGGRHSGDNRVQEVSEISRGLKMTARDLDVPIVALSQLSRTVEQRTDKRPVLSDLRESGSIEQDADVVLFLYRPSYYAEGETPSTELVEVNVAKNRNGPTDRAQLVFLREQARFSNPAPPRLAGDLGGLREAA